MVIFALATAAPESSVTMPDMSAFDVCAVAGGMIATARRIASKRGLDMKPPEFPEVLSEAYICEDEASDAVTRGTRCGIGS